MNYLDKVIDALSAHPKRIENAYTNFLLREDEEQQADEQPQEDKKIIIRKQKKA